MPIPDRLAEDLEALRTLGHTVEVVEDGSRFYVIVKDHSLPAVFVPLVTDVMVMADYQYPQSALDMFWTDPQVQMGSGGLPRNADQFEPHCGRNWQRWSWHYPGWNPATHNLITHLEVFQSRLEQAV